MNQLINRSVNIFYVVVISLFNWHCQSKASVEYEYIQPHYSLVQLTSTKDTLKFVLDSTSFGSISSINYFTSNEKEYISYYDKHAQSVNIYSFDSMKLIKRIFLKNCIKGRKLKRPVAYLKNFDTLFIANNFLSLYISDSSGTIKDSVTLQSKPFESFAHLSNVTPPVINNNILYMSSSPYLNTRKKSDLKKWKVIYRIDLKSGEIRLFYGLPEVYETNKFNILFFENSYCFNKNGRFVFSFTADTSIYETDLENFHKAYYGKSQFQTSEISMSDANNKEPSQKALLLRDSYSAIFFDPYTNRYLRVAEQKLSLKDYRSRKWKKRSSVIVFNEHFKIIGESELGDDIIAASIFFDKDGKMYARANLKDENALFFIRLEYKNK